MALGVWWWLGCRLCVCVGAGGSRFPPLVWLIVYSTPLLLAPALEWHLMPGISARRHQIPGAICYTAGEKSPHIWANRTLGKQPHFISKLCFHLEDCVFNSSLELSQKTALITVGWRSLLAAPGAADRMKEARLLPCRSVTQPLAARCQIIEGRLILDRPATGSQCSSAPWTAPRRNAIAIEAALQVHMTTCYRNALESIFRASGSILLSASHSGTAEEAPRKCGSFTDS